MAKNIWLTLLRARMGDTPSVNSMYYNRKASVLASVSARFGINSARDRNSFVTRSAIEALLD